MLKRILIIALTFIIMLGTFGCNEKEGEIIQFEPVVDTDNLPEEVETWVNDSLHTYGGQSFVDGNKLYLLVTYGEKPTGGYSVNITGVVKEKDKIIVTANFIEPGEDEMVTQALTYPYDLVIIETSDLPVEFKATGAENNIPQ